MRDQSPQPSQFVFPVALHPIEWTEETPRAKREPWGWVEVFVLVQVLWGVLLFMPGSQAYRIYIRGFPYVMSLVALFACARARGTDSAVPGAPWLMAAIALLIANLTHTSTWLMAGVAQIVFQVSIAAPIFWTARVWLTASRLERLLALLFGANFLSAALGLLQVYYPETFMPPEFSQLALRMNASVVGSLTYIGAGGREIIRPPGLSDLPGGAAVAGTITALLAFAFAVKSGEAPWRRIAFLGIAAIGLTVVYLTQVRSMLVMIVLCMLAVAMVRLRQGRVVQSGWIASSAVVLITGSFIWAVTVGGESVSERFGGMIDTGLVQSYQENRGLFLDYTLQELVYDYPFGAGVGRWGMMAVYFGEPENWRFPPLYAEIQVTGWLFDGGVLLWLFYGLAVAIAVYHTYQVAGNPHSELNDLAAMVLTIQLLVIGLCFIGPVFNTQMGILFWFLSAGVYGAERTAIAQEEARAREEEEEAEMSNGNPTT